VHRQHAEDAIGAVGDREVPDVTLHHGLQSARGIIVRMDALNRCGHDLGDRCRGRLTRRQDDALHQIAFSEDADELLPVNHTNGSDAAFGHQLHRIQNGGVPPDHDRRPLREAQQVVHGLLLHKKSTPRGRQAQCAGL
jgi:hypothetical protein